MWVVKINLIFVLRNKWPWTFGCLNNWKMTSRDICDSTFGDISRFMAFKRNHDSNVRTEALPIPSNDHLVLADNNHPGKSTNIDSLDVNISSNKTHALCADHLNETLPSTSTMIQNSFIGEEDLKYKANSAGQLQPKEFVDQHQESTNFVSETDINEEHALTNVGDVCESVRPTAEESTACSDAGSDLESWSGPRISSDPESWGISEQSLQSENDLATNHSLVHKVENEYNTRDNGNFDNIDAFEIVSNISNIVQENTDDDTNNETNPIAQDRNTNLIGITVSKGESNLVDTDIENLEFNPGNDEIGDDKSAANEISDATSFKYENRDKDSLREDIDIVDNNVADMIRDEQEMDKESSIIGVADDVDGNVSREALDDGEVNEGGSINWDGSAQEKSSGNVKLEEEGSIGYDEEQEEDETTENETMNIVPGNIVAGGSLTDISRRSTESCNNVSIRSNTDIELGPINEGRENISQNGWTLLEAWSVYATGVGVMPYWISNDGINSNVNSSILSKVKI